jgi:hypothetical protein
LKQFFLIFIFYAISLHAQHCIQVISGRDFEKNNLINEAKFLQDLQFSSVRIESRGKYLVLRFGQYTNYNSALHDLAITKKTYHDAYIRRCEIQNDKLVFPLQALKKASVTKQEPNVRSVVQKNVEKKYSYKHELNYNTQQRETSLWSDCQKCFSPMYQDEEEEN